MNRRPGSAAIPWGQALVAAAALVRLLVPVGRVRAALIGVGGATFVIGLLVASGARVARVEAAPRSSRSVGFSIGTFHGGYVLSAAALRGIASAGPASVSEEGNRQEPPLTVASGPKAACATALCNLRLGPEVRLKGSPPPTTPAFTCCSGLDPQVAASSESYLVIGTRQSIWFYDKSGHPLLERKLSTSATQDPTATFGEINLCDFFAPVIPAVNGALGLPTTKTDAEGHPIMVHDGYGINCGPKTGGVEPAGWRSDHGFYWPDDELYDTRVLWDERDKRFWIVSLFKNSNTVAFSDPKRDDPMMLRPATRSANVRSARRALLAVAVSKTQDPRDGWRLGWTWGVPGEGACPDCPGFGSDYLSMGISSKYVTLESAGGPITDPGRRAITIIPTAPVARGSDARVFWPDGTQLTKRLFQPAVQRGPDFDGGKDVFLAAPVYDKDNGLAGNKIQLTVIAPAGAEGTGPDLDQETVPVDRFHAVFSTDSNGHLSGDMLAPQKAGPGVTGNPTLSVAQNWVNKLVSRGSDLFLTMDECRQWTATACTFSAIRLVRIHLGSVTELFGKIMHVGATVVADRTITGFDRSNPGKSIWFGFPAVDVNARGDAVLAYDGTSPDLFPGVRYSVWYADESRERASRVLKKGQSTLGSSADGWHAGWHHYLGMSVDSFDGRGIWIIDGYADSGHGWSYAIGKVLGQRYADLAVVRETVVRVGADDPGKYRVTFDVANLGDGTAPAGSARIALVRPESPDVPLGSQAVPKLAPGHRVTLTSTVTAPPVAGYDMLGVSIPITSPREYETQNNDASVPLPH